MNIRGAPAIGVAGAFGMYLATLEITAHTNIREHLKNAASKLEMSSFCARDIHLLMYLYSRKNLQSAVAEL